jgi:hypothetical protein
VLAHNTVQLRILHLDKSLNTLYGSSEPPNTLIFRTSTLRLTYERKETPRPLEEEI